MKDSINTEPRLLSSSSVLAAASLRAVTYEIPTPDGNKVSRMRMTLDGEVNTFIQSVHRVSADIKLGDNRILSLKTLEVDGHVVRLFVWVCMDKLGFGVDAVSCGSVKLHDLRQVLYMDAQGEQEAEIVHEKELSRFKKKLEADGCVVESTSRLFVVKKFGVNIFSWGARK